MIVSEEEAQKRVAELQGWEVIEGMLYCSFSFENYSEAVAFAVQVAMLSDKLNHHPEITISYDEVEITLFTDDADALTEKDFMVAKAIDNLSNQN
jgi:4a-hydroxytetrahydrobiopterin dehydratase